MSTTTLHATAGTAALAGVTAGSTTAGSTTAASGSSGTIGQTGTATSVTAGGVSKAPTGTGTLTGFQGFLKTAGHVAGVVLSEIVKFVVPMAQVAAVADPAAAPALARP